MDINKKGESKYKGYKSIDDFDILYEQSNIHLLESDRKRDQILVLLVSITGLYIGNIDKLKVMPEFKGIAASIVIIGIVFAFVVLDYRKWHIKYSLACSVIQRLMFVQEENINQSYITQILRSIVVNTTLNGLYKTTETWIFNLYVSINCINIYIFLNCFTHSLKIIFTIIIAYFLIFNFVYYRSIKKLCDKERILSSSIWILNLYGKEKRM